MKNILLFLTLVLISGIQLSCSSEEKNLEGLWRVDRSDIPLHLKDNFCYYASFKTDGKGVYGTARFESPQKIFFSVTGFDITDWNYNNNIITIAYHVPEFKIVGTDKVSPEQTITEKWKVLQMDSTQFSAELTNHYDTSKVTATFTKSDFVIRY